MRVKCKKRSGPDANGHNGQNPMPAWAERFVHEEDGTVTVLAFFIFVTFLLMGGLGIDTMRQEMMRSQLQATLDRAVLAGATAGSKEGARAVVEDYFAKAGMSAYLEAEQEGDIEVSLNSAKVSANASMTIDTYLMKLAGVDTLSTRGGSTAEVRIPKLEIVMALDVSGSMAGDRLAKLKPAAKEFVTSIMSSTEPGDAVISIVPYSWGVSPPKSIFDALTVNKTHDYSWCIKLKDADFTTTTINPNVAYDQQIYTSKLGNTFGDLTTTPLGSFGDTYYRSCYTDEYFSILPYSISETALHDKIDGLQAAGSTSGDEGIKWASALLDPAFASVVTELQQNVVGEVTQDDGSTVEVHEVDSSLANLPAQFKTSDTLKVIVLMGDGANDTSYFFSSNSYRGPNSDLYELTHSEEEFSYAFDMYDSSRQWHGAQYEQYCYLDWLECVYVSTGDVTSSYYLRRPSDSRMYNVTDGGSMSWSSFWNIVDDLVEDDGETVRRLDWEEAWGLMSPDFYRTITGNSGPKNNYANNAITRSDKDTRMQNICAAAKANDNIIIFTIAFEMGGGTTAAEKIANCSTDSDEGTHHYNATKVNIKSAFSSIASNVKHLRLTQ
ncbi:Flp pilus assembly protein TadG [Roseovarius lutimaris]|uniref:Flp pilus assembly protein TadG n=2 Tax=Roseovarius lutimaris TaxID=1005928 RepID=A0A1I4ZAI6_9RHOB|nr:Flp pilus assembly protein TadG [Roseovarius lutimaris]